MLADKIAIITDDPGWHGRQLKSAFASRGYDSNFISLTECHLMLRGLQSQIVIPGFNQDQLAGLFIRGVPGGTLEQVILRLNLLHALTDMGIVVYNDGRAIERTVDKAMTSFLLKQQGIPTPDTWVCESEAQARSIVLEHTAHGGLLVMKPLFGSQGIGVRMVKSLDDLPLKEDEHPELYGGVFYLQSFVGQAHVNLSIQQNQDWRVFVINGRTEAMMLRTSHHWITNRAQGARCEAINHDQQLADLAEAAVRAVNIDYAGVDLMRDENGNFLVTEVNSVPAWWGLQKVSHFNIAERIADHFMAKIAATQQIEIIK